MCQNFERCDSIKALSSNFNVSINYIGHEYTTKTFIIYSFELFAGPMKVEHTQESFDVIL